ncbi:DinB family protein [Geothrix sp. 21YS21S-2]|uniref:DinB family protein n=1 Tax=Geothrix sp. 21YS21S-2 TaxID=3068893 RepID=UPI0027BA1C79|nr:DinB family protein [Geothrix sp. 21YS21S-2]
MPSSLFDHLRDMHDHMAWADAVWFEAWGTSGFQDDEDLRQRVRHMADTESAFLMVLRGEHVRFDPATPLPSFEALRTHTRANHEAYRALFREMPPEGLGRDLVVPWFPGPPCHITVDEALTQVAMHTQHHRGQLMTRLKGLGGKPLNVDYIIWTWKKRPEGRWA